MELRRQLQGAAREAGLLPAPAAGEAGTQATQQQVSSLLSGIINGERNVVQIGSASFLLRSHYGAEIMERAIPVVVAQVQQRRPPEPQGLPPGGAMPQQQMPGQQVPPQQVPEQPIQQPPSGN
jgi:hypothetical protein